MTMFGTSNQPQNAQSPRQAATLSLDNVMMGSTPSAFTKNDPLGTSVTGVIESIKAEQQTDFTTNEPLFYPNGDPKPQVVIHVKTSQHDPNRDFDDGVRAIYVKGYNIGGLRAASQQAGVGNFPRVGDQLTATFSSTKPASQRGFNDAKIYTYQVTPKTVNDLEQAMTHTPPQAAPQMGYTQTQQTQMAQQTGAAPAYQQPQAGYTQPMQPQVQQVDPQQILRLKNLGKTPQEIAGLLGITLQQVLAVTDAASPSMHQGSEDQPEF